MYHMSNSFNTVISIYKPTHPLLEDLVAYFHHPQIFHNFYSIPYSPLVRVSSCVRVVLSKLVHKIFTSQDRK